MLQIRDASPNDYQAIRELTFESFSKSEFGHNGEAELIEAIRASSKPLEFVAIHENQIVGHILFSPATIRSSELELSGLALGPMSVHSDNQRQGIGTALVEHALNRIDDKYPFACVVGHPEYYPRFGFQPAATFDIAHGFDGLPQEVFFVRFANADEIATRDVLKKSVESGQGKAYFSAEFGPQHVSA